MYDRVSLNRLLTRLGLNNFVVVGAAESRIEEFASFQLDECNGRIRKPDSLFVEASRPAAAADNTTSIHDTGQRPLKKSA